MEKHDIINISNETIADRKKEPYDNQKEFKKLFKKVFTNPTKHDIINISNELTTI